MYGEGPRKLSIIKSVRIKQVTVKQGFTVLFYNFFFFFLQETCCYTPGPFTHHTTDLCDLAVSVCVSNFFIIVSLRK